MMKEDLVIAHLFILEYLLTFNCSY